MIDDLGKVPSNIKKRIDKIHDDASRIIGEAYNYIKDYKLAISLSFRHNVLMLPNNDQIQML